MVDSTTMTIKYDTFNTIKILSYYINSLNVSIGARTFTVDILMKH